MKSLIQRMFPFLISQKKSPKKNLVYLDYAATTPMDQRVLQVMNNVYSHSYWNSGALYTCGTETHSLIEGIRKNLKSLLHTQNHQIIFTRGGTDACNTGIRGVLNAVQVRNSDVVPHIILSPIEHSAVRKTVYALAGSGLCTYDEIAIQNSGEISLESVAQLLRPETVLICVQYCNNETGVIHPIRELAKMLRDQRKKQNSTYPYLFCDAIAAGYMAGIHIQSLDADMVTLSASKFYGPKSVGILAVRDTVALIPSITGGDQEFGILSGTLDPAQIVGLGKAYGLACEERELVRTEIKLIKNILQESLEKLSRKYPGKILCNTPEKSISHIVHFSILGIDSDYAVLYFDNAGFCVASGSACSAKSGGISHVVESLWQANQYGIPAKEYAHIRVSLGRGTTQAQAKSFLLTLENLMKKTNNSHK